MTEHDANLPEEVLHAISRRKQEALEAETQALEEMIASNLDRQISGRQAAVRELAAASKRDAEELAVNELKSLQAFAEETLRRLDGELQKRRLERRKDEARRHDERIRKEKQEEEAKKRQAEAEAKKKASEDPAVRIRTLIRHAQSHMEHGDMEVAAKVVAEGLEIDGFNAELIDLDAKIREAMASDSFTTSTAPAREGEKKKGKEKAGKAKQPKPKAPPAAPSPAADDQSRGRRVTAWMITAAAALLVVTAALIVWFAYAPKPVEQGTTLAVLPWTSTGDAAETSLFTEAIPEIVVRTLSRTTTSVGLLGYNTTSNLASVGPDPVSSLIRLGYSHFLRGVLSLRDSTYSLHVELTDSTGAVLWSQDFRRDRAGMMLVPREIAHGLRSFLGDFGEPPMGTSLEVNNSGAYLSYLAGLNALRVPERQGVDSAIGAFNRALGFYPKFSEAYAGLSTALAAKYISTMSGAGNFLDAADSAASAAIALDPRSSAGYLARGRVLIERRRFQEALGTLDSAGRISPGETGVPFLRALALFRSGQPEQALEVIERAYRLDPRNTDVLDLMATIHQLNKSFDKALWYRETAKFFSGDSQRYIAGPLSDVIVLDPMLVLNQAERVVSASLRLLEQDPLEYTTLYSLARILQVSGDIDESTKYLNALETSLRSRVRANPGDIRARMYLGLTLTRLGRYADALSIGESAVAADTSDASAKYFLARIYALQMYSAQTKTVDSTKQSRALALLEEALRKRFIESQLCSADLYNIYNQSDIRRVLGGEDLGK